MFTYAVAHKLFKAAHVKVVWTALSLATLLEVRVWYAQQVLTALKGSQVSML
jgi:hypothetical protein